MIILSHNSRRWIAGLFAGQVLVLAAAADPTTDQIEALKQQIQALTEKVEALEQAHKAETAKAEAATPLTNATVVAPATNSAFVSAGPDGFSLQSANGEFILKLGGYAQVDARDYLRSAPGGKDTFTIRRLRAIASGSVYRDFEYFLQTDFASGITSSTTNNSFLQDAYVNIHHWDALQFQVGKMKEPYSVEWTPLDQFLWFLERGFPAQLSPVRDVGAEVHGLLWNGALSYQAGAYNGLPDGGSGDVEVADNDKDAVVRVIGTPFKNTQIDALQNFSFGLASTYGLQAGSTTPTFATVARQTFFAYSNTVSETGQHLRLDPQGYYYWGPFCGYWEYTISDEKFHNSAGKGKNAYFQNSGWDVVGSYFLTGESNVFGKLPNIDHPFRFDGTGWGAFQVAARFGEISLDPAAFPFYATSTSAERATSWSLSLNWYLNHNVKAIFEYDQTSFHGGSRTPGHVTANDEMALQGRLQFGF